MNTESKRQVGDYTSKLNKRRSRYHDYESAQQRNFRAWVHEDGSKMSEIEILAKKAMAKLKKYTTR